MKKLLLATAVAFFGLTNAQIKKGTLYLSGQAGFSQNKDNNTDNKNQDFSVIPTVGIFVAPNLAVGTGIGYKGNRTDNTDIFINSMGSGHTRIQSTVKTNAFVAAPFIRKYWTLADNLYIFGQLEVPVEIGKQTADAQLTSVDYVYAFEYS